MQEATPHVAVVPRCCKSTARGKTENRAMFCGRLVASGLRERCAELGRYDLRHCDEPPTPGTFSSQ